jgi:hypothetical protein
MEEKRINGVLCSRTSANEKWQEYSKETLTIALEANQRMVIRRDIRIEKLERQIANIKKALEGE